MEFRAMLKKLFKKTSTITNNKDNPVDDYQYYKIHSKLQKCV